MPNFKPTSSAIVVGAGLAGCQVAYELSRNGWQVTIVDRHADVATQASGNRAAITYPTVSVVPTPISRLAISGWKILRDLIAEHPKIQRSSCGSLKLLQTEQDKLRWPRAIEQHALSSDWMVLVDAHTASEIAGVKIPLSAVWMKQALWIDLVDYCRTILDSSKNIARQFCDEIVDFGSSKKSAWIKSQNGHILEADKIIFCGAYEISRLQKFRSLPFRRVRGQLAMLRSPIPNLSTIVCYDGFITPNIGNGLQQIGATYDRLANDLISRDYETEELLLKLQSVFPEYPLSKSIVSSTWTQYRSNLPGMEPIIGPACEPDGQALDHIFIFAGFASKGLVYIPSGARNLVQFMSGHETDSDFHRFSAKRFYGPVALTS